MLEAIEFEVTVTRTEMSESFCVATEAVLLGPGDVMTLTGPSGCGKSTLLEVLGLVLKPDPRSHYSWATADGRSMTLWGPGAYADSALKSALRARALGFMMQSGGLLPFLRVAENIALVRELAGKSRWDGTVDTLVDALDIGALLGRFPAQLSVGERQRVSVARALAHDPWLVLADEPTAALDPTRADGVMRLLEEIVQERRRIGVVVTHDLGLVRRLGLRHLRAHWDADNCVSFFSEPPVGG